MPTFCEGIFAGNAANSGYSRQWRQSNALSQILDFTLPASWCRQRRSLSGNSAKFIRQHISVARCVRKSEAVRQTAETIVDRMVNTTAKNKERKTIWPGLQWNPSTHGNIFIRSLRLPKQRQVAIRQGINNHAIGDHAGEGSHLLPAW